MINKKLIESIPIIYLPVFKLGSLCFNKFYSTKA